MSELMGSGSSSVVLMGNLLGSWPFGEIFECKNTEIGIFSVSPRANRNANLLARMCLVLATLFVK